MLVAQNPGWSSIAVRDSYLNRGSKDEERVALLRHIFFFWLNDLLSKTGETFRTKTLFQMITEKLNGIPGLEEKVAPDAIYITDICKACNFTMPQINGKLDKKALEKTLENCAENFFFKSEFPRINPFIILLFGRSAYSEFYKRFGDTFEIIYPPDVALKGNISGSISKMHGTILRVQYQNTEKYLLPFLHPSGGNRKYTKDAVKIIDTLDALGRIIRGSPP